MTTLIRCALSGKLIPLAKAVVLNLIEAGGHRDPNGQAVSVQVHVSRWHAQRSPLVQRGANGSFLARI